MGDDTIKVIILYFIHILITRLNYTKDDRPTTGQLQLAWETNKEKKKEKEDDAI